MQVGMGLPRNPIGGFIACFATHSGRHAGSKLDASSYTAILIQDESLAVLELAFDRAVVQEPLPPQGRVTLVVSAEKNGGNDNPCSAPSIGFADKSATIRIVADGAEKVAHRTSKSSWLDDEIPVCHEHGARNDWLVKMERPTVSQ